METKNYDEVSDCNIVNAIDLDSIDDVAGAWCRHGCLLGLCTDQSYAEHANNLSEGTPVGHDGRFFRREDGHRLDGLSDGRQLISMGEEEIHDTNDSRKPRLLSSTAHSLL